MTGAEVGAAATVIAGPMGADLLCMQFPLLARD
jgi:hypothetical protein